MHIQTPGDTLEKLSVSSVPFELINKLKSSNQEANTESLRAGREQKHTISICIYHPNHNVVVIIHSGSENDFGS